MKPLGLFAILCVATLAAVGIIVGMRAHNAASAFAHNSKILRDHGDILDLSEMSTYLGKRQPDSTPVYTDAYEAMQPGVDQDLFMVRTWKDPRCPEVARRVVRENAKTLALLDKAADMERPSWPRDWVKEGYDDDPPGVQWLNLFGLLVGARAKVKFLDGDLEGVLNDLRVIDKIVQHGMDYHSSTTTAIAYNLERQNFTSLLINRYHDDKQALLKIKEWWDHRPPVVSPFNELWATAAGCKNLLENEQRLSAMMAEQGSGGTETDTFSKAKLMASSTRRAASDICLQHCAELWTEADALKGSDDYFALLDMLYLHHLELWNDDTPEGQLARVALRLDRLGLAYAMELLANRRLGEMAIRLSLLKLEMGKWPDDLPSEWGALKRDPFTQEDMRYVWSRPGVTLYSVGKDGFDDGGVQQNGRGGGDVRIALKFN